MFRELQLPWKLISLNKQFVAGEQFQVEAGDVLACPGDQAHSYRNAGERPAVCFSVVALAARRRRR